MRHILLAFTALIFTGCATLNAPVAQIKPNQVDALNTKYKGKTIKDVYKDIGNPGTQGHWGSGEYAFIAMYPLGEEPSIPQYKFGMIQNSWKCYIFRFDKENGNKLIDVNFDDCGGGYKPSRVDHDYAAI